MPSNKYQSFNDTTAWLTSLNSTIQTTKTKVERIDSAVVTTSDGSSTLGGSMDANSNDITNVGTISTTNLNLTNGTFFNTMLGGSNNMVTGTGAGAALTTGSNHVIIGDGAGVSLSSGQSSVAVGYQSMYTTTSGNNNTGVGYQAGDAVTTGSNNTFLGSEADGAATFSNQTAIGYQATCTADNTMVLGNASVVNVRPMSDAGCDLGHASFRWQDVYASNGIIQTSDGDLKTIAPGFNYGLGFVNKLKPIEFKWADGGKRTHLGFNAHDVNQLIESKQVADFGGLIKPDDDETPMGLRMTEFIAPLVAAVQQLSSELESVKATLTAVQRKK